MGHIVKWLYMTQPSSAILVMFSKVRNSFRRLGVYGTIACFMNRMLLSPIGFYFKLDKWHAQSPYACRPYKRLVIGLADRTRVGSVVEIGCGLGDIVSRIKARDRIGFDIDPHVIRAASVLHKGVNFYACDRVYSNSIPSGSLVIMVNWIHNVEGVELQDMIGRLHPNIDYLILDRISINNTNNYKIRHDFNFLRESFDELDSVTDEEERRTFVLFKAKG